MLALFLSQFLTLAVMAPPQSVLRPSEGYVLIPWEKTPDFTDRRAVVFGRVVAAKNTGQRCFLNFDEDWEHHFTVTIDSSQFKNFPQPPEKLFDGKNVVVFGLIQGELS